MSNLFDGLNIISDIIKPPSNDAIYTWAEKNFDYSKCISYETPYRTKYSIKSFPFFKQIMDDILNSKVREVYLLKNSRAGASEQTIFMPIRYLILNSPTNILYVTNDQYAAENTMRQRFVYGMEGSEELNNKTKNRCRVKEHELVYDDMSLIVAWSKQKSVTKSQGFKYLFLDELSTFTPENTQMLLKRTGCYKNSKVVGISSPCPNNKYSSEDDVIFNQFEKGTMSEWYMPDPKTGNLFKFELGGIDVKYGLKWDIDCKREDGTWDLNLIKKNAYYVTPDGTRIDNKDRLECVKKGQWIDQNSSNDESIKSYKITSFISPFASCDFGNIAVAFINAKNDKKLMKVFCYEHLAEKFIDNVTQIHENQLKARMRYYKIGESPLEKDNLILNNSLLEEQKEQKEDDDIIYKDFYIKNTHTRYGSCDVQKMSLYYTINEWYDNGDTAVLDCGNIIEFAELDDICKKYDVAKCGIDMAYEMRRGEVLTYCYNYKDIPLFGRDNLKMPYMQKILDPYEGKLGGGAKKNKIITYEYSSDIYSSILFNMLDGSDKSTLYLPSNIPPNLQRQIVSTYNVDGNWITRKGYKDDHIWDCLKMQVVLANIMGYYNFGNIYR